MTTMTWQAAIERLNLTWCQTCSLTQRQHDKGMLVDRTVHWRPRRFTKPGLHKLLLVIATKQGYYDDFTAWHRTYLTNRDILAMAREIGVRLPREVFDLDRAKLRHELSVVPDRQRLLPSEQYDYKKARRWAARS